MLPVFSKTRCCCISRGRKLPGRLCPSTLALLSGGQGSVAANSVLSRGTLLVPKEAKQELV